MVAGKRTETTHIVSTVMVMCRLHFGVQLGRSGGLEGLCSLVAVHLSYEITGTSVGLQHLFAYFYQRI